MLTADHTNQLTHPEYTNAKGLYEVPIAFYYAGQTQGYVDSIQPVSQTDIMPSVLECLNYDKSYFAFGEDAVTGYKNHRYAVCYNNPVYQIFSDSLLVQFDGVHTTAVYNYRTDRLLEHNLVESNLESSSSNLKSSPSNFESSPSNLESSPSNLVSFPEPLPKEDAQNQEIQDMVRYLKAYIQQYIARMTENRLTTDAD